VQICIEHIRFGHSGRVPPALRSFASSAPRAPSAFPVLSTKNWVGRKRTIGRDRLWVFRMSCLHTACTLTSSQLQQGKPLALGASDGHQVLLGRWGLKSCIEVPKAILSWLYIFVVPKRFPEYRGASSVCQAIVNTPWAPANADSE